MKNNIKEFLSSEKTKKILVFTLLWLLFAGSMYLIFAPSAKEEETVTEGGGINTTIPQAMEDNMTDDKLKAYEFAPEEKNEERNRAIETLSELYGNDTVAPNGNTHQTDHLSENNHIGRSVRQYQETSEILNTFYDNEYDLEKEEMREEIERLNKEISEMENAGNEMDEQLALMEKSYQMASKYLPVNGNIGQPPATKEEGASKKEADKDRFAFEVLPDNKPLVSSLAQPVSDEELLSEYSVERNIGFNTPTATTDLGTKNTIACKVDRTVTVRDNETLQLRLLESVRIGNAVIPRNTLLTARSKLYENRMLLLVSTIEVGEYIYPVKLTAYDMDGLEGVFIPGSEEIDALKEIGANIGNSIGTSFTFSSSAKDQIIADAAKGLMQGTSNYIVRKIKTVKVTFKGGHRLMLMPSK